MSHAVPLFEEYHMIKDISGSSGALVFLAVDQKTMAKCVVKFLPFSIDRDYHEAIKKGKKQSNAAVQKMAKEILAEISTACIMSYDERRYFTGLIRFGDTQKLNIKNNSHEYNVIRLDNHERFQNQMGLFMVMPYLENYTDMLNLPMRYSDLSEVTKFEILAEILRAYQVASNVVGAYFHHTDSHSKNILIDVDRSSGVLRGLKLIDFDSAAFSTSKHKKIDDEYLMALEHDMTKYATRPDDRILSSYMTGFPYDASGVSVRMIRRLLVRWDYKGAIATVGYSAILAWKLIAYALGNSMSENSKLGQWLMGEHLLYDYADYDSNFQNLISLLHDKSYFPNSADHARLVAKYQQFSVFPLST